MVLFLIIERFTSVDSSMIRKNCFEPACEHTATQIFFLDNIVTFGEIGSFSITFQLMVI